MDTIKIVNGEVPWDEIGKRTEVDGPHAWIQWKGTNVCMDVHCSCGTLGHVDSEFAYFVRCKDCGQAWAVGSNVRLVPLSEAPLTGCEAIEFDNQDGPREDPELRNDIAEMLSLLRRLNRDAGVDPLDEKLNTELRAFIARINAYGRCGGSP